MPQAAMPFVTRSPSGSRPIDLGGDDNDASGAFGFMGKTSDAFSFVGDEISKNKTDI